MKIGLKSINFIRRLYRGNVSSRPFLKFGVILSTVLKIGDWQMQKCKISAQYLNNYVCWAKKNHRNMGCE